MAAEKVLVAEPLRWRGVEGAAEKVLVVEPLRWRGVKEPWFVSPERSR